MTQKMKNIASSALAVIMVFALIIGGSIAYYTVTSDQVDNNFDVPDMDIDLTEDGDQEYTVIPGTTEDKDPIVTVTSTIDTYVFLFVTDDTQGLVDYSILSDWILLEDADVEEGITVYYQVQSADAGTVSYHILTDGTVSYDSSLTLEDVADTEDVMLSFYAIAVQKEGFGDALDAFTSINNVEDEYVWYGDEEDYAEENGVITLSGDGTLILTASVSSITVENEASVVINARDNDIISEEAGVAAIYVEYGSEATINSYGEIANTANQESSASGSAAIYNNGTITVNGGTYSAESDGDCSWYTVINHGTMTINDGTFTNEAASTNSSLVENGYYTPDSGVETTGYVEGVNQENPVLVINGGTFTSTASTAIKNDECGILTINGGEFTAKTNGWSVYNYADATINGGTFNSKVYTKYKASNTMPSTVEGATIVVTGGAFNATFDANSGAVVEISGGTFVNDVSDYLVSGYTLETDDDGNYVVAAE